MQRVVQIEAVCPGKSTVLRVFTGYLPPSEGAVHVGGYDALEHPLEIRKYVGYVPEDAPLYDGMRVLAGKRTVIVASHVLTEIDKLATRVMILREGELLTADAMAEEAPPRTSPARIRTARCGAKHPAPGLGRGQRRRCDGW